MRDTRHLRPWLLAITCVAAAVISGCDTGRQDTQTETASAAEAPGTASAEQVSAEQQRLMDYLAAMDRENLERSPIFASFRGEKMGQDSWSNLTDTYQDETLAIWQRRRQELQGFDAAQLDNTAALSLRIAQLSNDRAIEGDQFRHHEYIMQQFRAWHTMVPSVLISIHRVGSVADLEAYLSRLEKVGTLFDQVIEQMQVRAKRGVYPPRWSYPQMLEASTNVITGAPFDDGADSTLLADFKSKLDGLNLDQAKATAFMTRANEALLQVVQPAYGRLIDALRAQQSVAPEGDGVWRLPNGEAYYNYLLRYYTTTDLNAEQVHQMGLENVARIHNEMRAIMAKVEFTGSLQEFFAFMRDDPQFYFPNTDTGREAYLGEAKALVDIIAKRLPDYFGILPQADMIVKRVEPFRERSAGKAFYQSPTPDGSRPGIYYANLYNMADMPKYQMEALAYHEGIPGHHMQRAITGELEGVPEFQKYVSFTAYTEGWGLYSEYLPKEMGFYQDPYSDFGRLAMELWRACRLVVDTGLHAKQWSREKAIQYLQDNTPNPAGDTVKAIERYIVYPGQATAYLIGKIKILELREQARSALKDKFDIRGFHDEVLKDGPVPLSLLEEKIAAWIEQQRS
ncbi:DUF885 domain-containing protein [Exilibacterium tricleocarpae]|uniref:DUF885 domain-containing protein n=1 Tax=Exilibacterium tricleocarpae TaxID=2591008 RepID=A0A545TNJ7_9GAMM|nr:DUF885 domain-containing protein [Exilibacterium tricleocarpae]TQV78758.1 DUF885 domain-containing protein [Exilibacterium tricleocarpae]